MWLNVFVWRVPFSIDFYVMSDPVPTLSWIELKGSDSVVVYTLFVDAPVTF